MILTEAVKWGIFVYHKRNYFAFISETAEKKRPKRITDQFKPRSGMRMRMPDLGLIGRPYGVG